MHDVINPRWVVLTTLLSLSVIVIMLRLTCHRQRPSRGLPDCAERQTELLSLVSTTVPYGFIVEETELLLVQGLHGRLYITLYIQGSPTLFFIDTGYAGPPVINPWHQAREQAVIDRNGQSNWELADLAARVDMCDHISDLPSVSDRSDAFAAQHSCTAFASTCTMRLAGIASESERVTDMVVCPALVPHPTAGGSNGRKRHPRADLLVSFAMEGVPHILTIDYLLAHKHATLQLDPDAPRLVLGHPAPEAWVKLDTQMRHGAFATKLTVQVGEESATGWFTIDSGSAPPLVLGRSFALLLGVEDADVETIGYVQQMGINSELTCATVLPTARITLPAAVGIVDCPIMCNDTNTAGVDGYIGLTMLTAWGGIHVSTKPHAVHIPPLPKAVINIADDFFDGSTLSECGSR